MNTVWDIAVISVFVLSIVAAWKRGFFRTLMGLVSWIVAVIGSIILTAPVADAIPHPPPQTPLVMLLTGVALFVVLSILLRILAAVIGQLFRLPLLRTADQLVGALIGLVDGVFSGCLLSLGVYALCAASVWPEVLTPAVYEQTHLIQPLVETILSFVK